MRQIPERRNLLGSGRAQEPRRMELHCTALRDQLEQHTRRQVSISPLMRGTIEFFSVVCWCRNPLYIGAWPALILFSPTLPFRRTILIESSRLIGIIGMQGEANWWMEIFQDHLRTFIRIPWVLHEILTFSCVIISLIFIVGLPLITPPTHHSVFS